METEFYKSAARRYFSCDAKQTTGHIWTENNEPAIYALTSLRRFGSERPIGLMLCPGRGSSEIKVLNQCCYEI
eukprot:scaffold94114_cov23-Prasinocladus_malaysianus.AAC.2